MTNQFFKVIKYLLILLLFAAICYASLAYSHENDKYKHKKPPRCYGWERLGNNVFKCFLDKDNNMCAKLIYSHGIFHVSEPFECSDN